MPFLFAVLCMAAGPIYEMSAAEVDAYLMELRARRPDFGNRLVAIAADSLGTPYMRDPLGEGPDGEYDKDPLLDLGRVDCVTFIEQVIALAASTSYDETLRTVQRIRYKNGRISFETRNHFMIADWIKNNGFCRPFTGKSLPVERATRTMGRKHFFNSKGIPALAEKALDEPLTITYIPVSAAASAEKELPSPALILLIGKLEWLFTLHCGLFVRDTSGTGLLYNASSTEQKVVAQEFKSVFARTDRYIGFTAYTIGAP